MARSRPDVDDTIVLVPIRSFDGAKRRLASSLGPQARRALIRGMAETVVAAAHDLPVWVVTDDDEVADWARARNVLSCAVGVSGLNPAVTAAAAAAADAGATRIIIAHADLPYALDLRVVTGPGVALAPDRQRDGSNVMSLPTNTGFVFAYGPGSFAAHRNEAARLGLDFREIDDASLAWDVDSPADLPTQPISPAREHRPLPVK